MRRKFCCDASKDLYEKYYINQSGTGLTVFSGSRGQRGHGIGSMLSGFFKNSLPFIKRGLVAFGKQAARTGLDIAHDVLDENKSFTEALETRGKAGIKSLASDAVDHLRSQLGSGIRSRKRKRGRVASTKTNKRRRKTSTGVRKKRRGTKKKKAKRRRRRSKKICLF